MDKKIAVIFDLDDTLYSKNEVFFKTFCNRKGSLKNEHDVNGKSDVA